MDKYLLRSNSSSILNSNSSKRPADEPNDEDWRAPKRPVSSNQTKFDTSRNLETHNRFENLPVEETTPTTTSNNFKAASFAIKKSGHVPPIILEMKPEWTHQTVRDLVTKYSNRFHLQYRSGNKVAVICYSPDAHQMVKDGLRSEDTCYLTYTRKDEKTPKVVIKGLPCYTENEVSDALDKIGFPGTSVKKLKTKSPNAVCPPLMVQLPTGADLMKFRQIKYLFNCVISIEKFKPRNVIGTQCFRCQRFGHSSMNSNMTPRCVKCTEPHPTSDCPKKDRKSPAFCCNCGHQHPANYSKCASRVSYLSNMSTKNKRNTTKISEKIHQKNQQEHAKSSNPPTNMDRPWNSIVTGDIPRESYTTAPDDAALKEMFDILTAIKKLKPQFVACNSTLEKVMLVLSHLGRYV